MSWKYSLVFASLLSTGFSHNCYVCEPDVVKQEDLLEIKRSFPNIKVPQCSSYSPENVAHFLRECPSSSQGCLTKFEGNGNILRTCAPIGIDDCKEANGITYCYCSKDACNKPERRLIEPVAAGNRQPPPASPSNAAAGSFSLTESLQQHQHNNGGHQQPRSNRRLIDDDEDHVPADGSEPQHYPYDWNYSMYDELGSGDWDGFYYENYEDFPSYESSYGNGDPDVGLPPPAWHDDDVGFSGGGRPDDITSGGFKDDDADDDTEPEDDRFSSGGGHAADYYDMTEPPPFIEQELEEELAKISQSGGGGNGGHHHHKYDRRPIVGDEGIEIVESGSNSGGTSRGGSEETFVRVIVGSGATGLALACSSWHLIVILASAWFTVTAATSDTLWALRHGQPAAAK